MRKILILFTKEHFERYCLRENDFFKNPVYKIYAFTIEIRLLLQDEKIPYEIPEKFMSEELAEELDEKAIYLSQNWHRDLFKFAGLSLGWVDQRMYFPFFAKILRTIEFFISIIKNESPDEIISFRDKDPHIEEINACIKYICSIKGIKLNFVQKEKEIRPSILDIIGNSNLYKFLIKFVINLTLKIRNLRDFFITKNRRFNILMEGYKFHKSVLDLCARRFNLTLLDDSPDLLKNKEIFKFFKAKNQISHKFFESYKTNKIERKAKSIFKKYLPIWEKTIEEPSFKEIFNYRGFSYYPLIKKRIIRIFHLHFKSNIQTLLIAYKILTEVNYSLIVFEVDLRNRSRIFSYLAFKMNIPTMVIQHGVTGHYISYIPSLCTKLAMWGKISRDYLVDKGLDINQTTITGAPRFDEYTHLINNVNFMKKIRISTYDDFNINKNKKLILFTSTHNHFFKRTNAIDFFHDEIENLLKMTIRIMEKLPNAHMIMKLHPGDSRGDIPRKIRDNLGLKNISVIEHYNIVDLLVSCDCLITNYSTTIIEAMMLHKPIVVINFRKSMEGIPFKRYNTAHQVSNYDDLLDKVKLALNNPVPLNNYEKFLKDYIFKTDGRSSRRVVDLIEDLLNDNV